MYFTKHTNLERSIAEDYDKFIEYISIYSTITKDTTLLDEKILLAPKNAEIDFISDIDGVNYFIEVKGRNNTSTKYDDGNMLENSKLQSFYKKVSEKLNFNYTGDNYVELLQLCNDNNYKLYYYNYFTDDILIVWNIADAIMNGKFTDGSHYAPKASTKGFTGYNRSTTKKTYLLKNEHSERRKENLLGRDRDIKFQKFRIHIQKVRDRFKH